MNHSFSFVWRDGHVCDFVLENEEKENIPYLDAYTYYLFDYLYYIGEIWEKAILGCVAVYCFLVLYIHFVIPVYFLLLHIQEIGRADNFPLYYIGFNFLFPFLFLWVRYRKERKSALMKHYRYPKKIKVISAIFFLLVPIAICGLEMWIYGKQGWIIVY